MYMCPKIAEAVDRMWESRLPAMSLEYIAILKLRRSVLQLELLNDELVDVYQTYSMPNNTLK